MCSLTADGQPLFVAQPTIRVEIRQPLDVHGDLSTKIPLDLVLGVEDGSNCRDFLLGEAVGLLVPVDTGLIGDLLRARPSDSEDVGQRDFNPLRFR